MVKANGFTANCREAAFSCNRRTHLMHFSVVSQGNGTSLLRFSVYGYGLQAAFQTEMPCGRSVLERYGKCVPIRRNMGAKRDCLTASDKAEHALPNGGVQRTGSCSTAAGYRTHCICRRSLHSAGQEERCSAILFRSQRIVRMMDGVQRPEQLPGPVVVLQVELFCVQKH